MKQEKRIIFRLSDEEYSNIQGIISSLGITQSDFFRYLSSIDIVSKKIRNKVKNYIDGVEEEIKYNNPKQFFIDIYSKFFSEIDFVKMFYITIEKKIEIQKKYLEKTLKEFERIRKKENIEYQDLTDLSNFFDYEEKEEEMNEP